MFDDVDEFPRGVGIGEGAVVRQAAQFPEDSYHLGEGRLGHTRAVVLQHGHLVLRTGVVDGVDGE